MALMICLYNLVYTTLIVLSSRERCVQQSMSTRRCPPRGKPPCNLGGA